MMTMLRLLPMGLFGAFLGAWAERLDRRRTLIGVIILMATNSATLGLLAQSGHLQVWHLALSCFVNGLGWATDNPVRRVLIGESVGPDGMGTAMSLDAGANNATRLVGPAVAGIILTYQGVAGVFAVSAGIYVIALIAAIRIRSRDTRTVSPGAVLSRIAEGLRLVRADQRLIGTLVVTVIYNLFGWPFTAMIPVIGRDRFGLGPEGVGVLASIDGIGAFAGAVVLAMLIRPAWYARAYVGGVIVYLTMLSVFALAPSTGIGGAALLITGFGGAGFSTMQATLVYLASPAEMRSRILGVLSVCIGTGPIGFVWLGLLADMVGAPLATAATGGIGLLAMLATRPLWRRI
jgi:predicted MFS family arabinose efflux permease